MEDITGKSIHAGRFSRRAKALFAHYLLVLHVPGAWIRSLLRSKLLLGGQWSRYMGFQPKHALNCLFYRTQWINIDRYGRNGCSPIAGLGQYPLSRWIYITAISLYVYAHAGAATMLGGTLAWALMHLAWLQAAEPWWVLLSTLTLMFSTTAYAMAFVRQNYNILGWLWLPLVLLAVTSQQWVIAALALFAASLASVTVIFVAAPLMLAQFLVSQNIEALLILIPALSKIALHSRTLLQSGDMKVTLFNVGKLIGVVSAPARYKRAKKGLNFFDVYFPALYLSASALSWYVHGVVPWLTALAVLIFVMNQRFIRFADHQSVVILCTTAFAAHTLAMPPSAVGLALLFLVANPLPFMLGIVETCPANGSQRISVFKPFDHSRIEQECESLFESVPAGSRVLFAFEDPDGIYQNLFDGYRNVVELFLYVATHRSVHLFPDWHAVAETNTDGEFYIWGRSLNTVHRNIDHWQADYVLYYLASDDALPDDWLSRYRIVGTVDFANYLDDLRQAEPWSSDKPCPKFLMLQPIAS